LGELIPYMKTLRERGIVVSYRELKSRFIREAPKICIRRIMDLCEEYASVFTFCVVGVTAEDNPGVIKEMICRGHEVACHGYEHLRFDLLTYDEVYENLQRAKQLFLDKFNYELKGFRAPYLKTSKTVDRALADLGFMWSSSIESKNGMLRDSNGVSELPVVLDDWEILVKRNESHRGLLKSMKANAKDGAVFLLHPWRVGQRGYIRALRMFLGRVNYPCVSMQELARSQVGMALTGDLGEMSLVEVIRRSLTWT